MEEISPHSLLLVDDHAIWRSGVMAMLRGSEFKVVGEAGNSHRRDPTRNRDGAASIQADCPLCGGDGDQSPP